MRDYDVCDSCKYQDFLNSGSEPCLKCNDNNHYEHFEVESGHLKDEPLCTEIFEDHINPDHYKSETSLECIEAMEVIFGNSAVYNFCLCNAWKYIWRWKNKNGKEDLKKAMWYVDRARCYIDSNTRPVVLDGLNDYILKNLEFGGN